MLRKYFLSFAVSFLLLSPVAYAQEGVIVGPSNNLLLNPGFENDLANWRIWGDSPAWESQTQIIHSGQKAAKVTITRSGTGFFRELNQEIVVTQGQTLYATVWAKLNFNKQSRAVIGLSIAFQDSIGNYYAAGEDIIGGTTDWQQLYVSIPVPNTTRALFRLFVYSNDPFAENQSGYFDDAALSTSPIPAPPKRTVFSNAGFENSFVPWTDLYGYSTTLSSTARTGAQSARKTIQRIPGQSNYSSMYQDLYYNTNGDPYPANTPIYATTYVKTNIPRNTKSRAGLHLEFINAGGQVIRGTNGKPIVIDDILFGLTDWRYLYGSRVVPPGTVRVRVNGFIYATEPASLLGGEAFFDDFNFSLKPLTPPPLRTVLSNGNFENSINDWTETDGDTGTAQISSDIIHAGSYAIRFDYPEHFEESAMAAEYFDYLAQDIRIRWYDGSHKFSAWVKTDFQGVKASIAGISLVYLDVNNNPLGPEKVQWIIRTQDWTLLSVTGTPPSKRAVKARVKCYVYASDLSFLGRKAYFDDATFSWVSIPVKDRTEKPAMIKSAVAKPALK